MLPSSSLTVPDVQLSRFRFFMEEFRSRRCSDGRSGLPAPRMWSTRAHDRRSNSLLSCSADCRGAQSVRTSNRAIEVVQLRITEEGTRSLLGVSALCHRRRLRRTDIPLTWGNKPEPAKSAFIPSLLTGKARFHVGGGNETMPLVGVSFPLKLRAPPPSTNTVYIAPGCFSLPIAFA
jgi:hypothetical protein